MPQNLDLLSKITQTTLVSIARFLVGAQAKNLNKDASIQRIYFANHTSHLDSVALWSSLPSSLRLTTRPVAALDYWGQGFRRFLSKRGFNAVYIDRKNTLKNVNVLEPLEEALRVGDSLIIFPEGTRGEECLPAPFKKGLYHLASHYPKAQLIPVYMDTLRRSMPKGCFLPIPLNCTVHFGEPLVWIEGEDKEAFLNRAHEAVCGLAKLEEWG